MHICGDEIMAFVMMVPFVGAAIAWVRAKVRR